jgi:cell division protein FtsB
MMGTTDAARERARRALSVVRAGRVIIILTLP